jgi:hypothetical protein
MLGLFVGRKILKRHEHCRELAATSRDDDWRVIVDDAVEQRFSF